MTATLLLAIGLVGYVVLGFLALRAEYHAGRPARRPLLLGIPFVIAAGLIARDLFLPHPREEMRLATGLMLVLMLLVAVLVWVIVGSGPEPRTYAPRARAEHETEDRA